MAYSAAPSESSRSDDSYSSDESGTSYSSMTEEYDTHMSLLQGSIAVDKLGEIRASPVFTEAVRSHATVVSRSSKQKPFTQYGLLAGVVTGKSRRVNKAEDPRIFYNITAPSSVFICGSQGSGKSHTLSCLLENCLIPTSANVLPRPLTGIVFHYDTFVSDSGGSPCEAAYLSSKTGIKVRVLCAPTNVRQIERIYEALENVTVEELRIDEKDLNTKRMFDLMAVNSTAGDSAPLYIAIVQRILRELRICQQRVGGGFNYTAFRQAVNSSPLLPGQKMPLEQRLETLESFMVKEQTYWDKKKKKGSSFRPRDVWAPKAGQLTIVDLSCPCITPQMACALFTICLSLFLEQRTEIGRVVALDEAHKYMTDSAECEQLTESLLSTIRLQRHLAARIFISTQEPTISPKLLDLCSVTIVHRFTSPDWLQTLKKHLAGASELARAELLNKENDDDGDIKGVAALPIGSSDALAVQLFSKIVNLHTGEALLFAPSAVIGIRSTTRQPEPRHEDKIKDVLGTGPADESECEPSDDEEDNESVRLGHGVLKVRVRQRVTQDGGRSVMAS